MGNFLIVKPYFAICSIDQFQNRTACRSLSTAAFTHQPQSLSSAYLKSNTVQRFGQRGVAVTVCTDNRTCSQTSLEREYALVRQHLGFTDAELRRANANGARAAFFLTEEEKRAFAAALESGV